MFDTSGLDRLSEWKKFRDLIEESEDPFSLVINFWSAVPFVGKYLDPYNSASWPDPWQLILDGKFDDLGIALGILYTLKLTQRFGKSNFKIYSKILENDILYFLSINDQIIFDISSRTLVNQNTIEFSNLSLIYKI